MKDLNNPKIKSFKYDIFFDKKSPIYDQNGNYLMLTTELLEKKVDTTTHDRTRDFTLDLKDEYYCLRIDVPAKGENMLVKINEIKGVVEVLTIEDRIGSTYIEDWAILENVIAGETKRIHKSFFDKVESKFGNLHEE